MSKCLCKCGHQQSDHDILDWDDNGHVAIGFCQKCDCDHFEKIKLEET